MITDNENPKPSLRRVDPEQLLRQGPKMSVERGRLYYQARRAVVQDAGDETATVLVSGSQAEPYRVEIWLDPDEPRRLIHVECDCPFAEGDKQRFCKHKVAALLEMRRYFKENKAARWLDVVGRLIEDAAKPTKPIQRNALMFVLRTYAGTSSVAPYSIAASYFHGVIPEDPEELAQTISRERLSRVSRQFMNRLNPKSYRQTRPEHIAAANLLISAERDYRDVSPSYDLLMPLLEGALIYEGTWQDPLESRLQVTTTPARLELHVDRPDRGVTMSAALAIGDRRVTVDRTSVSIISRDPLWAVVDSTITPVQGSAESLASFINTPTLVVPESDVDRCLEFAVPRLAEQMEVVGDAIGEWADLELPPVPRLYLHETSGELTADLRFGYGDHELDYSTELPAQTVKRNAESKQLVRVHRDAEAENRHWRSLSSYGLKRGADKETFVLRQNTGPVDFLVHHVPKLANDGFEVYGEENLKSVKVNREKPKISISVSSGIDWFDLDAIVTFGDLEVPLSQIRKAVKKRESYIKLADGSIGQIPEEWIDRYRHLFDLADEKDGALRLSKSQVMLLDQVISDVDSAKVDVELARRLEKLRDFSQIDQKPLPAGFKGEMRNYQKAGYYWLHFLHEYEFGGCLADDMGIGKTVQTLTFLLSLHESGHATAADLIVMPRSLLINWVREAEKFTPGLKVLVYADLDRPKDVAEFEGYDIVITTYGIMRRDHEILGQYKFHYAVLDESQSVKNPLAQTARVARHLNAEHRLVLTGTPVENSTVELWSQFAFLNPGMFGSLEYFKKEFSSPIERKQDEDTARQLRAMIHPFILRRTKEQVAKELPPRTERIVYCEMDPVQHRAYVRWRDQYRALLLGMIEDKGVSGSRMKILEGLLRLRQIANHPKLAEKDYKGGSAKLEVLIETLETLRAEGHKALVFSQFTEMLKIVRTELDALKIPYVYLDGHTKDRESRIDAFQNDENIPFFLISLKAGGVGLNLTAADYVIHIDPWWNPAVERQASDRTHRIGQRKPVFVHKLIVRDTVEEKMLELQDRKRNLVDKLVSAESGIFKSLTAEDVGALFS